MDLSAALPTFVVTLREGFEAVLVVGIVLACIQKAGQNSLKFWVYLGLGAGVVASALFGIVLAGIFQGVTATSGIYTQVVKQFLEALFGVIAIAMLSWMLVWMTQQAKSMKQEMEQAIRDTLASNSRANWGIFLLVFIAVFREGIETVLFIIAQFQIGWTIPALGAVAGLLAAAMLGILLFRWGVRINVRLFFQVMGVLLLLIVGGLLVGVLQHLDRAIALWGEIDVRFSSLCLHGSNSCILGMQIWDASSILPDNKFPGILLKTLFGYRQTIYLGQIVGYLLFMVTVGSAYFQSLGGTTKNTKNPVKASS